MDVKILSRALASRDLKIRFKTESLFAHFITPNGEIRSAVDGVNMGATSNELVNLFYQTLKEYYSLYITLKDAFRFYGLRSVAYVKEYNETKSEINIRLIKENKLFAMLVDTGKINSPTKSMPAMIYETPIMGHLINADAPDDVIISLVKNSSYYSEDMVTIPTPDEIRWIIRNFLKCVPANCKTGGEYLELFNTINNDLNTCSEKIAITYMIVEGLLNNPNDKAFATDAGVTVHNYELNYKPILEKILEYVGSYMAYHTLRFRKFVEEGNLIIANNYNVTKGMNSPGDDSYIVEENYNKYIEANSDTEGAAEALLGVLISNDEKADKITVEQLQLEIPKYLETYNRYLELNAKSSKNLKAIKLAEEFTDGYGAFLDSLIEIDSNLREAIAVAMGDNDTPTMNEVVNNAYQMIIASDELSDQRVVEICYTITEPIMNKIAPYLGTFTKGLAMKMADGKSLEKGDVILGAISQVAGEIIMKELEIVEG